MGFLRIVRQKVYSKASKYISHATLVDGILKGTSQPFRCLFVENSNLAQYMLPRLYQDSPRILRSWRILIPSLKKVIKGSSDSIDMCIAVLLQEYESNFQQLYNFKAQEWSHQMLDISKSWDDIKKEYHKNPKETGRKVRKYGYTYNISYDINDFNIFYHKMYLPLIQKQFGNISHIDSYDEMKSFFLRGFLLLVINNNGDAISGGLCFTEGNILIFRRIGVLNGDENHIKKGAQSAVYHFIISLAKDNGFQKVDLMKSRSLLNDGVYVTKREWGAAVYPDDESESWVYFFILRHSAKIAGFFEKNPLIVHTKDGLSGVVGWNGSVEPSAEDKKELCKKFYAPGIQNMLLLTSQSKEAVGFSFKDYSV